MIIVESQESYRFIIWKILIKRRAYRLLYKVEQNIPNYDG